MTWVITKLCTDCKDTECVSVCPVDCIYELTTPDEKYGNQLYIEPNECINCTACEPACPWQAIFEDDKVPELFKDDIERNVQVFLDHPREEFTTSPNPIKKGPTSDEIEANKKKWNYSG